MSIDLDEVNLDSLDLDKISRMLELNLMHIEQNTKSSEEERVRKEREIAKRTLFYPTIAQLPNPFAMQANPQVSALGQRISNIPEINGINRITEAAGQALPSSRKIPGSIFDIASLPPAQVPPPNIIENAQSNLRDAQDRGIGNALGAHEPKEILESVEDIAAALDLPNEELIEDALANVSTPFPNLAREIMALGIGMEGFQTKKLMGHKKQGDEHKESINHLLKLSSHLPKLTSDDVSYELKQEAKIAIIEVHEVLKEKGIDIFPGMTIENDLSKEQLSAAHSLINHHIDVNRNSLQELFTTKISVAIQFLSMIGEVMKKVSEKDDQLKRKTSQLPH